MGLVEVNIVFTLSGIGSPTIDIDTKHKYPRIGQTNTIIQVGVELVCNSLSSFISTNVLEIYNSCYVSIHIFGIGVAHL